MKRKARRNTRSQARKKETPTERLSVEELERRIALSVPDQKKNPFPPPYPPGALYGLAKRSNLKGKP